MFGRTIEKQVINEARKEPTVITVHEHRAPLDESIRLLADMEKAAREKIIGQIRVKGAWLECVVQVDYVADDDKVRLTAVFSVEKPTGFNKNTTVEHRFRPAERPIGAPASWVPKEEILRLKQKIAEQLASIMLHDAWEKLGTVNYAPPAERA